MIARFRILLFLFIMAQTCLVNAQEKASVIIDADTGNEVDDLYAIVRCLIDSSFHIAGLNSAQWQASHWAVPNTLENSHRLNLELLSYLQMDTIPHPRGGRDRLYDWGDDIAQHSAAAYHIIKEAHRTPPGEKLIVVVLGASTNLASAILIDPEIVSKIKVYLVGTTLDIENLTWRKDDFNCMMDLHAIDIIFDTEGLETHIMPINMLYGFSFTIDETRREFEGKHPLLDFLYMRWVNHVGGAKYSRIVWDLALVEGLIHPEYAHEILVDTPPENSSRKVYVYTSIDEVAMKADFFRSLREYFE